MTQGSFRLRRLRSVERGFEDRLVELLRDDAVLDAELERQVRAIVEEVRERGDEALLDYTRRYDRREVETIEALRVPLAELERAYTALGAEQRDALDHAARRIRAYHQRQLDESWSFEEADGTVLGQVIRPLERVGVYAPGGKAAYPSSVLMAAIPARVAGVGELVMCAPGVGGCVNPLVLAAAHVAEVERVWSVGGAQAVAALAYGTASIAPVDKIVGPGNAYVTMAKRLVFGRVGIDMLAGPSEIVIVADGTTPAEWIAMDLFSQAEHDEDARALLLSPNEGYLDEVQAVLERLLPGMDRRAIIERSLLDKGALIETPDIAAAIAIVNRIAPEHLELSIEDARAWLPKVRNAGAIFLGAYSSEVLGDYCAGPNHVLPTSRTARFSSPLGVYDFQKRSSVIDCSRRGASTMARVAAVLARGEGLSAHARAAELRLAEEGS